MSFEELVAKDGFAIVSGFLSRTDVGRVLDGISADPRPRSRAGIRHALSLAPIAELANSPNLLVLARAVLGSSAFPYRATLFDKSRRSNWLVVWHQDTALPVREHQSIAGWGPWSKKDGVTYAHAPGKTLSQVLVLRIHLDDSTEHNGPLRVLPSTHNLGVLDDDRIHALSTTISPIDCLVPAGGIVAMRPLLVHSSSKSRADADRRVVHIEYAAHASIAKPLALAIT